jgi:hypothetical protein
MRLSLELLAGITSPLFPPQSPLFPQKSVDNYWISGDFHHISTDFGEIWWWRREYLAASTV